MRFRPTMEQLETRETPAILSKLAFVLETANSILPPPPDGTTPIVTPPVLPPAPPPVLPPVPPLPSIP